MIDAIFISIYTSYWYTLCSIIDYYRNKEDYNKHSDWNNTLSKVIPNVYFYFPLSLFLLFLYAPTSGYINLWYIELRNIILNIMVGELYFYTVHRLFHHRLLYRWHKDHHRYKNTIGIHALYAHPVDVIILNFGSFYILHLYLGFSLFQVIFVGSITVALSIWSAHTSGKKDFHQYHHILWNKNYGMGLFMDKIMNTAYLEN